MFEPVLPPLLKADLDDQSRGFMTGLEMADWGPVWKVGEEAPTRVRAFSAGKLALFDGSRPTGVSIPIVAYVVRAGDLTLAVDTGLGDRLRDAAFEPPPEEGPAPGMRYRPVLEGPSSAEQLAREGIHLDRALCTHLHHDHAGGARALGVPVEASSEELAVALAGDARGYPADDLDGVSFIPMRLDQGPVGSFVRHAVIAPGLLALSTPGHTPGSISVFACLGGAWTLLCGDAVYPLADAPRSPAFLGMLRIRRALEEIDGILVLPGHDTAALRACADGAWLGTD